MNKQRKAVIEGFEISEITEVELGGIRQKILIEGKTGDLPVVISLHGGPGTPIPFCAGARGLFPEFTDRCILVCWDQYGCGINNARLDDDVTISLRDAYFGTTHSVNFTSNVKCDKCDGHGTDDGKPAPVCPRCGGSGFVQTRQGFFAVETPCPECNGLGRKISKKCSKCDGAGVVRKSRTLDVKIPAGVQDGARLRLAGQGEAGQNGAPAGDFYIDIHIAPDDKFERVDNDLITKVDVPFTTLAMGGEIDVKTIDDKELSVKVPSGTQIGSRLRVRGKGMPNPHRAGSFGDMYIEITMTVPTKLSEKQKKALAEFAGVKPNKKSGWF